MEGVYEYLYPRVEMLKEKPFKADKILEMANKTGLNPTIVRVDNALGQIIFYFENPLKPKEKKALDELVNNLFKEWG